MEIYHKNKDQHDKGLSDEVLKDLLELQRINKIEPKKMDQITDVSSLFKYDMEMRIGDKIRRFQNGSGYIMKRLIFLRLENIRKKKRTKTETDVKR